MADKIFAEGIYFDRREGAPDFVVGRIGMNRDKAIQWLSEQPVNDRGYLNLNVAQSRNGKYYVELDTWQPSDKPVADGGRSQGGKAPYREPGTYGPPGGVDLDDDLPF